MNNFEKLFDSVCQTSKQKEYLTFHKKRFETLYAIIRRLNSKNILDIGATGFTHMLKIEGYDISALNKKDCNLEVDKIPYRDNSFNLIIYTEVIEHLHKGYLGSLQEIYRVLKPAGYILFGTPNTKALWKLCRLGEINKTHFKEFSMQECSTMLESAGFSIIFKKFMTYLYFSKKKPLHSIYYLIVKHIPRFQESILILGMKK